MRYHRSTIGSIQPPGAPPFQARPWRRWWMSRFVANVMFTNIALLGLLEWRTLSKAQRRFVLRRYIIPLVTRWQLAVAKMILVMLAIAALLWLGAFSRTSTTVIVFVGAVFLIPGIFDLAFIARSRQQIGSIIRSHETEIRSAA